MLSTHKFVIVILVFALLSVNALSAEEDLPPHFRSNSNSAQVNEVPLTEEEIKKIEEETAKMYQRLDAQLRHPKIGPSWVPEQDFLASIDAHKDQFEIKEIECAQTFCRLIFDFSNQEFAESFPSQLSVEGAILYRYNDRPLTLTAYIFKKGVDVSHYM